MFFANFFFEIFFPMREKVCQTFYRTTIIIVKNVTRFTIIVNLGSNLYLVFVSLIFLESITYFNWFFPLDYKFI